MTSRGGTGDRGRVGRIHRLHGPRPAPWAMSPRLTSAAGPTPTPRSSPPRRPRSTPPPDPSGVAGRGVRQPERDYPPQDAPPAGEVVDPAGLGGRVLGSLGRCSCELGFLGVGELARPRGRWTSTGVWIEPDPRDVGLWGGFQGRKCRPIERRLTVMDRRYRAPDQQPRRDADGPETPDAVPTGRSPSVGTYLRLGRCIRDGLPRVHPAEMGGPDKNPPPSNLSRTSSRSTTR